MRTKGPIKHGTFYAYSARGCRCTECKAANAAHSAADLVKRSERGLAEGDDRHGTPYAYHQWGCRCALCTKAWAEYMSGLRVELAELKKTGR